MDMGIEAKLKDYIDNSAEWSYIQGTVIDINIYDDTHTAEAINQLLKGGIRIV